MNYLAASKPGMKIHGLRISEGGRKADATMCGLEYSGNPYSGWIVGNDLADVNCKKCKAILDHYLK
jgi:hypothetical protein